MSLVAKIKSIDKQSVLYEIRNNVKCIPRETVCPSSVCLSFLPSSWSAIGTIGRVRAYITLHVPAKNWSDHTRWGAYNLCEDTVKDSYIQACWAWCCQGWRAKMHVTCVWEFARTRAHSHTHMHIVLIFWAQDFFPFHWGVISQHTTETERQTVAQWSLLQPALSVSPASCINITMQKGGRYPQAKIWNQLTTS